MKKALTILLVLLLLTGCGKTAVTVTNNKSITTDTESISETVQNESQQKSQNVSGESVTLNSIEYDLTVSNRDLSGSYDEINGTIVFSETGVSVTGEVTADGNNVTINQEGTYMISGKGKGSIIISADDQAKIQLVLNSLTLESVDNAAIVVSTADKVFITLAENTVNTISDSSSYEASCDGSEVDGAIFSKEDLTINGTGKLIVNGKKAHGIVCKDELRIVSATVEVSSQKSAVTGNDAVKLVNADVVLKAVTDGIKSENDSQETPGYIYVSESSLDVTAADNGLQAQGAIIVESGNITVNAGKDGLHSDDSIIISGGNITIKATDDGIHGEYLVEVNGGSISVNAAEGLEATIVRINDGDVTVNAKDDGVNAAKKVSGVTPLIEINGGTLTVTMGQGDTDGLDSNGNLVINGGYITINASSPFDYDISGTLNGGTVIVNGSKVTQLTSQMMGGGMKGQQGFGGRGH